jgi:hypothetical protein
MEFCFNCCGLEIRLDNRIGHVPRCYQNHAQNIRPKLSIISPFQVEALALSLIVQTGLSIALCMKFWLPVECF